MIPESALINYRLQANHMFNCDIIKHKGVPAGENLYFKTKPYKHQIVCVYLGLMFPQGMLFFVDLGGGKSKIILDILANLPRHGSAWKRCLILSPNVSTVFSWSDEIRKHSDFSFVELVGSSTEKWQALESYGMGSKIVLLNYAGMVAMLSNVERLSSKKGKLVVRPELMEKFSSMFDVVVYDEVHKCGNPRSLTFKIARKLSESCKYRFGMTGTPINRNPLDLWAEFMVVDGGKTFGNNFFVFRNAYFKPKKTFWGVDWVFRREYEENLYRRMKHRSIRYTKEEMIDLPKVSNLNIKVEPTDEVEKWYNEFGQFVSSNDRRDFLQKRNTFMVLREICSGFIQNQDVKIRTNKIEVLSDLLDDIPDSSQVVIFLDFVKSGEIVSDLLKKKSITHERLFGMTKDKLFVKDAFLSRKIKALVANIRSGGTGLNLQTANYVIFYELPLSYREYVQACNRVHRPGQTKPVFIYNLITKGTIEEKIRQILDEGRDVTKAIVDGEFDKYFSIRKTK